MLRLYPTLFVALVLASCGFSKITMPGASGRIINEKTGLPLDNVEIRITNIGDGKSAVVRTGKLGEFHLPATVEGGLNMGSSVSVSLQLHLTIITSNDSLDWTTINGYFKRNADVDDPVINYGVIKIPDYRIDK